MSFESWSASFHYSRGCKSFRPSSLFPFPRPMYRLLTEIHLQGSTRE